MTYQRISDSVATHDRFLRAISASLDVELENLGDPAVRLVSIRSHSDFLLVYDDVVVTLVLPGGIPMTVDCWSDLKAELGTNIVDGFDENVAAATAMVMDFVEDCHEYGFDKIAALFEDARRVASVHSAKDSSGNGHSFSLDALELSFRPFWRNTGVLIFKAGYSSLNEWLRAASFTEEEIHDEQELRKVLRNAGDEFARRAAAKRRLSAYGATGEIDLLAINLLKQKGDPQDQLRRLPKKYPWEGDIGVKCGRAFARTTICGSPTVSIDGNEIRVYCTELPEARLVNAHDKPITDIVDSPLFSPEMIVIDARHERRNDSTDVLFEIRQPRYFYCGSSGRIWEPHTVG